MVEGQCHKTCRRKTHRGCQKEEIGGQDRKGGGDAPADIESVLGNKGIWNRESNTARKSKHLVGWKFRTDNGKHVAATENGIKYHSCE